MRTFVVQSNAWQLVHHADLMTQIVLISLFLMAIFCWTVFLYKAILWRMKKRHLTQVLAQLKVASSIEDIVQIAVRHNGTIGGYLVSKVLARLKILLQTDGGAVRTQVNDRDWQQFEYDAHQIGEEIVYKEERLLSVVSAFASVSLLLGLFGTVWGLINSFIGISHKQSADISAVAPGIAQALVTTVGGLIVAVPGYLIYSYLATQLRAIDYLTNQVIDRFLAIVLRTIGGGQK